jgi:lysylphosphatidylglycerol synthetase-like protein (DUF2156 family)
MKNLIAAAVVICVAGTFVVLIKVDFKYARFTEEIKTLYAFFLGVIGTFILVISMAMIYDKKENFKMGKMEETNYLEQEEINEIYRNKDQIPLGCLGIIALFIIIIVLLIYVILNYRI